MYFSRTLFHEKHKGLLHFIKIIIKILFQSLNAENDVQEVDFEQHGLAKNTELPMPTSVSFIYSVLPD